MAIIKQIPYLLAKDSNQLFPKVFLAFCNSCWEKRELQLSINSSWLEAELRIATTSFMCNQTGYAHL